MDRSIRIDASLCKIDSLAVSPSIYSSVRSLIELCSVYNLQVLLVKDYIAFAISATIILDTNKASLSQ